MRLRILVRQWHVRTRNLVHYGLAVARGVCLAHASGWKNGKDPMSLLLNLIYLSAMVLLSPWLVWRVVVQKKNRHGFGQKFFGRVPQRVGDGQCLWFHAVSVGEVKLLKPVIDGILARSPETEIVVSSTTQTGRTLAAELYPDQLTFYSPADFSWALKRAFNRIRPTAIVLAELELWPNLIHLATAREIKVCVLNGRLSEKSSRGYSKFSFLCRPMFEKLAWVGAQSESYAARFIHNGCGPDRVTVTGSVKFDGVETDRANEQTLRLRAVARQAGIGKKSFTFLAGSTQAEEDLLVATAWKTAAATSDQLRLILVPRHPARVGKLTESLDAIDVPWILRSSIDDGAISASKSVSNSGGSTLPPVLIVDVIGELCGWWGVADSGFVGGSMGSRGGQSMIEPAGLGVPVCFGPNTANFSDTVEQLIENEAAEVVHDGKQLLAFMQWSLRTPHLASAMGQRAQQVVRRNQGAAQRTVDKLVDMAGIETKRRESTDGNYSNQKVA